MSNDVSSIKNGDSDISSSCADYNSVALPAPLCACKSRFVIGVLITTFFTVAGSIIGQEAKILFFLFIPLYLAGKALSIQRDWAKKLILEVHVYCRLVRASALQDRVIVSFCTYDESGNPDKYFQFSLPNRKRADEFIPDAPYIIYFREREPNSLLAFSLC